MSWPVVALGDVADTALGKMLDKGKDSGRTRVQYLRNVNVQWGRIDTDDLLTMELAAEERDRFEVRVNDLLVCEGGEIGRCAIWPGRPEYIAFQKALHRIRPSDHLDAKFLRYLLEHYSNTGALEKLSTGSTIAHLPQQQLRRLPIPLPSVGLQRRIVEQLEDHLSRLDAAARTTQHANRRLRALERSVLAKHFGGCAVIPLSELVDGISAGKSFGKSSPPAGEAEWGIIKVSAMTWGKFRPSENKAVPEPMVDAKFEIREGDLLVSRANTADYVGASVLVGPVRRRLLLSDKSLRVTPRAGVSAEWLWRALQSPSARAQISKLATGTKDSMRNISQSSLLQVLLPVADTKGQAKALAEFNALAVSVERLREEIAKCERRNQMLRRSALNGAFTGRFTESSTAATRERQPA